MRRLYVEDGVWKEVFDFAFDRWVKFKERSQFGKPLHMNFSASLEAYIHYLKSKKL